MRMKLFPYLMLAATVVTLAACGTADKPAPCAICYEDEWSREPFPGQAKQHFKALTPEDLKANGGRAPLMPLAVSGTAQ